MNLGKARQRITFLCPPDKRDKDGFPNKDWIPQVTVWAELNTLKGRSFYLASQTNLESSLEFIIRYRTDLNDNMRILWKGKEYDLASPIENIDGLNKEMKVIVKAVN